MPAPKYTITANQKDGTHQRNPSWVLAFVRFNEPASMYSEAFDSSSQEQREKLAITIMQDVKHSTLVVENDCIGVSVDNPKSSFAKIASLRMKVGDIYYPYAVAPGDWVMVWMVNSQTDADQISLLLKSNSNGGGALNDFLSGFKFLGRVTNVSDSDDVSINGVRTLTQSITCQAFLEMATSIYYTALSKAAPDPALDVPANSGDAATNQANAQEANDRATKIFTDANLRGALTKNIGDKFLDFYNKALTDGSIIAPDSVIMFSFMLAMGVDKVDNKANLDGAIQGEFSDSITIPSILSKYLNLQNASRLWQIYNLYLGLQNYGQTDETAPWLSAFPQISSNNIVSVPVGPNGSTDAFFLSSTRCKGAVPFTPPLWDNVNLWQFLTRFLHPVTNEMYTALRVNKDNRILPSLVVREKPFGTNLFGILNLTPALNIKTQNQNNQPQSGLDSTNADTTSDELPKKVKEMNFTSDSVFLNPDQTSRAMFGNVFRWVIDESMLSAVRTTVSENYRVNFVQVFGRSAGLEMLFPKIDQEKLKQQQFSIGNFVYDSADIKRNGLRSIIMESEFDVPVKGSQAPFWAKMNADWLFNGHLKPYGTITLYGVQEPICEGDNVQVRGIVYHIDNVSHAGAIGQDGKKSFMTTLSVSNGILASSLDSNNPTVLPAYPCHNRNPLRSNVSIKSPGVTDIQYIQSTRRKTNGDAK